MVPASEDPAVRRVLTADDDVKKRNVVRAIARARRGLTDAADDYEIAAAMLGKSHPQHAFLQRCAANLRVERTQIDMQLSEILR